MGRPPQGEGSSHLQLHLSSPHRVWWHFDFACAPNNRYLSCRRLLRGVAFGQRPGPPLPLGGQEASLSSRFIERRPFHIVRCLQLAAHNLFPNLPHDTLPLFQNHNTSPQTPTIKALALDSNPRPDKIKMHERVSLCKGLPVACHGSLVSHRDGQSRPSHALQLFLTASTY